MDRKIWYLKNANIFSWMNEAEIEKLARESEMLHCKKKNLFYLPEETSARVYLVKEGKVRLARTSLDGREVTLDIIGPGEIFGEMAVAGEEQRSHLAEAMEDSMVCAISKKQFNNFLQQHPDLTFKVMRLIGFRRRELETRLEDLAFLPVAERLKNTLVRLGEKHGREDGNGLQVPISQKDLAYLVGASRETVAEELGNLKRQGLIKTSYRKIIINDIDGLQPDEKI